MDPTWTLAQATVRMAGCATAGGMQGWRCTSSALDDMQDALRVL